MRDPFKSSLCKYVYIVFAIFLFFTLIPAKGDNVCTLLYANGNRYTCFCHILNHIVSSFYYYYLLSIFLGYSYPLLTLTKDSAWFLEGLSNLSRRSRLALGHLYPRSKQRLSYALATINHYQSSVTKLSD